MDEFEDVTLKEKTFMKLWNRFLHRHAILADFQVCMSAHVHWCPALARARAHTHTHTHTH
jgi:hypothetical protein